MVREEIDQPVRALDDGADALARRDDVALLVAHAPVREPKADEAPRLERADQQVTPPVAKRITGVEGRAGRRDDRIPVVHGGLHPRPGRSHADLRARIVDAVRDDRPAVVLPGLRLVELVAAARPVLHRPQPTLRVEGGRLDVAMAVRPDLGPRACAPDERIVFRNRAVRIDPHDLAERVAEVLRVLAVRVPVAERDEEGAVETEDETGAPVIVARDLGFLTPDHLRALEAALAESTARHRGTAA